MGNLLDKLRKGNDSAYEKMKEQIKQQENKGFKKDDEDYWYPEVDKVGDGYAVIRLLPTWPKYGNDDHQQIEFFSHFFKGPGGWYIDNCPTTVGDDCPVCKHNGKLWNTGIKENKDTASNRKRKQQFIVNIYVVHDSQNPENEGQVFKFKMGPKLWETVKMKMFPKEKFGDKPVNVFDIENGADFQIKIRRVDKQRNYDLSGFGATGPVSHFNGEALSDEEMNTALEGTFSLAEMVAEKEFKSYEKYEERHRKIVGLTDADDEADSYDEQEETPDEGLQEDEDFLNGVNEKEEKSPSEEKDTPTFNEDDDDILAEFSGLID